jgi:hypothetical protein
MRAADCGFLNSHHLSRTRSIHMQAASYRACCLILQVSLTQLWLVYGL